MPQGWQVTAVIRKQSRYRLAAYTSVGKFHHTLARACGLDEILVDVQLREVVDCCGDPKVRFV
jgi:hypothetical protein